MKISFGWWNTSLSPTKDAKRALQEDKCMALVVISEFLVHRQIGVLGMCELSTADVVGLRSYCAAIGYEVLDGTSVIGRTTFDTCVIYRRDLFDLLEMPMEVVVSWLGNTQKIAQHMVLKIKHDQRCLHLLVSHWPSVMLKNPNTEMRDLLGNYLRRKIDDIWRADAEALVIAMGDFNDEPFHRPLAFWLQASRDKGLVASHAGRLYNPFWRKLGSLQHYVPGEHREVCAGTYFHHANSLDRWRTFDQIIFSSHFLGLTDWHLDESSVAIVDIPAYTQQV